MKKFVFYSQFTAIVTGMLFNLANGHNVTVWLRAVGVS
jgi:hypothetical protein